MSVMSGYTTHFPKIQLTLHKKVARSAVRFVLSSLRLLPVYPFLLVVSRGVV